MAKTAQVRAHHEVTRAEVPTMALQLQAVLGQRLVAFACGVRSPRQVGGWARGGGIYDKHEDRLRSLFRAFWILRDAGETDSTIRAWFAGANPELGDEAPVEVIRGGERDAAVFMAAESFVA